MTNRLSRRTFLKTAVAGAAVITTPVTLRAQAKTFKLGAVHPVTGPLAEPGQACRLGAQMAVEAVNAAGGIKSKDGVKLELVLGDTQTKTENGRVEAERVVTQGARMLMGSFDSGTTNGMVSVAQQRRVPFLVDIAAADQITANVAKSVAEGQQKVQYVYRNFPTGSSFGRKAVQYFGEIFAEAKVTPRRVVLMYCNDLFGQTQSRGFLAAYKAAKPAWTLLEDDVIAWPEPPSDLSTEVSRVKSLKPDVISPITRPASAQILLPEIRKQRLDILGIVGPGSPGFYEAGQIAILKDDVEYAMVSNPWANFKNPRTIQVAEEYRKRSNGKTFDTNSGYSYDAVHVIADVLERAVSLDDPDAIVDAIKKTSFGGGLMQYAGPIRFNELGDNPNAVTTMTQILSQKPVAVWPREAALQKFVFPRPGRKRLDVILVAQGLLSGLLFGGVYSLMAVGLTLIFGVMRVVNFAHGDMMVWGMYLAFVLATRAGLDPYLAFPVCAVALFALGVVVQRGLVDPIIEAPHEMQILLMLGVALVLENTALLIFGPEPARVRSPLARLAWEVGPLYVDVARLVTFAVAVVLTLALSLFLYRTDLGRLIRASADNHYGALVIGADVRRIYATAFGIGAACVGAAGALVSPILPFQPPTGLSLSITSFNIVIIGGMGSLVGAFIGGLLVSVAESLGAVFLRPSLKELFSFSLLIVILLFRPAGLFGKRTP